MIKKYSIYFFSIFTVFYLTLYYFLPTLKIITGYAAKTMASEVYIGEKSLKSIQKNQFNHSYFKWIEFDHDTKNKTIYASFWGDLAKRKAIYKKGLGCILIDDLEMNHLGHHNLENFEAYSSKKDETSLWPKGELVYPDKIPEIDYQQLKFALNNAFIENSIEGKKNTNSVVVIYDGKLVAEKYKMGLSKEHKMLGWSMTKTVMNTLIGILIQENKVRLEQDHLFESWDDERENITIEHLLSMRSGLEWDEDFSQLSNATRLLFLKSDMVDFAKKLELDENPGSTWLYSSASSILIAGFIKSLFATNQDYWSFPQTYLFQKLNMEMILETDQKGDFVGSSYAWATPRDWAKLALLYYNKGNYNGDQILSEEWVRYSTKPNTPKVSKNYGAGFWLNADQNQMDDIPADCYNFNGYRGQRIFVIPSKKLIVVRFGNSYGGGFDQNEFLHEFVKAVK